MSRPLIASFDAYLLKLRETPVAEHTEHTGRGALETLLGVFAPKGVRVQHEPKREKDKGAPDFKISKPGAILGYVEVKEVGTNLDRVLKSDQIRRYRELSDNILVTDYLQWIWIDATTVREREILAFPSDLESRKSRLAPERAEAVGRLLDAFFSQAPQGVGRARQLALALATRSRLLRDYLGEELVRQQREHREGKLFGLFEIFRDQVFHELTTADFADAFAQMLAYGLFLARLNSGDKVVTLANARQFVPGSFRLIRELVDFLKDLDDADYQEVRWVVEEVLSIVNNLDLPAIHADLSFGVRKAVSRKVRANDEEEHWLFERDPFIYFYEDYLKAYDATMRKSRGVYYTPPPVVNFIVRAVDDILKEKFAIRAGLADSRRVTVLDFACGTGTFLLEVFQQVFENIGGADAGKAAPMVREHLLKNIYGFEYLIAPYTIAHLKLSQFLHDRGHPLASGERLQVFLTNTLEPIEPQRNLLLPAISAEVQAAQEVKDKPILVILGNPPYSGHSKNKGAWISAAIDGYKYTIETDETGKEFQKPLGERNPKWLNDDYVKFIRFAQLKMDAVEEGVVGIITNHSWLDNTTFRGMRQSLMRTFDQIYVLDLHGNAKKKETAPDGSKDENIFDIEQGVAISLFIKKPGLERGVWRGDLWGKRLEKYKAAAEKRLKKTDFSTVRPMPPFLIFAPENSFVRDEYHQGWRLPDIYQVNVLGFQTHRDDFAISFTETETKKKLADFSNPRISNEEITQLYGIESNRDWSLETSRQNLRKGGPPTLRTVSYRPFDERWCEYSNLTMDYPRRELLDHVIGRENIILGVGRAGVAIPERPWELVMISTIPVDANIFRRGGINLFPIYVYNSEIRQESLAKDFRKHVNYFFKHEYDPEQILGYIYAILHAPTYRRRYAEFLRIDFPRIPFAAAHEDFEKLSALGGELIDAHLLRGLAQGALANYHGKGEDAVDKPRYAEAEARVYINEAQYFDPLPKEIWNFHIGGYRVIEKYLKSRKGRKLSLAEIEQVGAIAHSLAFTLRQMEKIDAAWLRAFPDRG